MPAITAAMIKELRDRTSVGMGKCKEALEEANGDMELAIVNLRKAGMASAVKKEGRETKEGMIGISENSHTVAIVEVNAETDFVVRNERFKQFLDAIAEEAAKSQPSSLDAFLQQPYSKEPTLTVDQYRATMVQTIGENIQIRRLKLLNKGEGRSVGVYSHLGGKIVTAIELAGSDNEVDLAKEIALHTAAAAPEYLSPDQVPEQVLDNEKEIAKSQIHGKPANIVDKIVEGKLNAFYDANCLVCQKFIKDDTLTISDLLHKNTKDNQQPLAITSFIRWVVGQ